MYELAVVGREKAVPAREFEESGRESEEPWAEFDKSGRNSKNLGRKSKRSVRESKVLGRDLEAPDTTLPGSWTPRKSSPGGIITAFCLTISLCNVCVDLRGHN